jgi:hypothetical protein
VTSDGIRDADWRKVHAAALRVANASSRPWLGRLRRQLRRHPDEAERAHAAELAKAIRTSRVPINARR